MWQWSRGDHSPIVLFWKALFRFVKSICLFKDIYYYVIISGHTNMSSLFKSYTYTNSYFILPAMRMPFPTDPKFSQLHVACFRNAFQKQEINNNKTKWKIRNMPENKTDTKNTPKSDKRYRCGRCSTQRGWTRICVALLSQAQIFSKD